MTFCKNKRINMFEIEVVVDVQSLERFHPVEDLFREGLQVVVVQPTARVSSERHTMNKANRQEGDIDD